MIIGDPIYILLVLLPSMIIASYASFKVHYYFDKYAKVLPSSRLTGEEAARKMLNYCGINDVKIEHTNGLIGDHYDTTNKTLRLSENVFNGMSIYAVGVACHEVGHAIQHAESYAPLSLRTILVPVVSVMNYLSFIVIFLGFILLSSQIIFIGITLFCIVILFALITLPVEYNASSRAKKLAYEAGIVYSHEEIEMISKVLDAAFMTYIALVANSILTLLYFILKARSFRR